MQVHRVASIAAVLAVALLAPLVPVAAQESDGFRSPSGNIHCQADQFDDGKEKGYALRCDLSKIANAPPPKPKDCDLDWGRAFEISDKGSKGVWLCYGDTVANDGLPPLAYGATWQRFGFTCKSSQAGVTCSNENGHGFELSRGKQRVF